MRENTRAFPLSQRTLRFLIGSAVAPSPMATNQPRATCVRENCATLSLTTHNTKNQLAKHAAMCEEWGDKKVTALAAAVKRR